MLLSVFYTGNNRNLEGKVINFFFIHTYFLFLNLIVWGLSCGTWDLQHGSQAQLPGGLWDLSFQTRDQTHIPCIARQILNHWTTREVPLHTILR